MQNLDVQSVVMNLAAIGRELDRLSREAAAQDEVVVRAYSAHRKAYAEAFTSGAGSVKDREQAAVLVCEPLKLEAELAEQVLRAMKERVKVLRDRLEIGRSVNAAIRTQFTTEGIGQS
jgi:biopolymer transport protein ExbB/TolQ